MIAVPIADALLEMERAWIGPQGRNTSAEVFIRHFLRRGEDRMPIMEAYEFYNGVLWRALGIHTDSVYGRFYYRLQKAGLLVKPHGLIGRRVVDAGWSDLALDVKKLADSDRGTVPWIWRIDTNKETA